MTHAAPPGGTGETGGGQPGGGQSGGGQSGGGQPIGSTVGGATGAGVGGSVGGDVRDDTRDEAREAKREQARHDHRKSDWAAGGSVFGGAMMLVFGVLGVMQGIAGIAEDEVYNRIGDYVFKFDLTTWGWIHLIFGVLLIVAGYGVLTGADWGRFLGILFASLMVVAEFMWLPYQPFWALITIGIGVFVIWSLCSDWGRPADR